jgi:hypothetical protein
MVDGLKILRRLFSIAIIFLMVLPNFIIPVSAATEARMIYSIDFDGITVTSVDTNLAGTRTVAGLANGTIICFDNTGSTLWSYDVPSTGDATIKELKMDDTGYVAFLTKAGDNGILSLTGVLLGYNALNPAYNTTDIDLGRSDQVYFASYNSTGLEVLYGFKNNAILYQNQSPYTVSHPAIEYDSVNGIVVATNVSISGMPSNRIYMYNVSNYTGWLVFNPLKLAKNSSQATLDTFPYRQNISTNNGNTVSVNFTFIDNVSHTGQITKLSNGTYTFNASTQGKYFLWTYGNGLNITQPMINISTWNATRKQYIVNIKPTASPASNNLTFYYGRTDYTNEIVTGMYNITQNVSVTTNASGWTAPLNAQYVFKINVTGSGGGGATPSDSPSDCAGSGTCRFGGPGGTSTATSGTYGWIAPSTYFAFTIPDGGAGASCSCGPPCSGTSGSTSTAFGLSSSGGVGGSSYVGSKAAAAGTNHAYYLNEMKGGYGNPGQRPTIGGDGGSGYGSGGGGGEPNEGYYCNAKDGGKGASGAVNFTYWTWTPQYFMGAAGTSPYLGPIQYEDVSSSMNYVTSLDITGNATALSIPEGGGMVGVSTAGVSSGVAGKLYHIVTTPTGFGAQYSGTSDIGIPLQIATSDAGTYSIEARGSWIDIYQLDGTLKGQYNTGGIVNSVDIADRNGLWACAGGTDGVFYVFDKATTSGWEVYYQGDSLGSINSVAMSEGGEYAAVGRSDGTFEYYNLKSSVAAAEAIFSVDIFVTKGGVPYPNVNVSVVEFSNTIPQLVTGSNITTTTDTNGHYLFTVTEKNYYNISVNDGEYYQLYQASPTYKVIAINLNYPLMSRPFSYASTYNAATKTITTTYNDVNTADVNISIVDVASKTTIYTTGYLGTKSVTNNYVVPDGNKSYKTVINFTRTTGAKYSDTVYLQSPLFNSIPKNTSDQYTLFIYAIYTLLLMVVALSIGSYSLKFGTVFLVALTFLGITLGFLPISLYTVGIATSAFIALLEVYRRRE